MRRKPRIIRTKPKLKAWRKVDDPLIQRIIKTYQAKAYPFDGALVQVRDLVEHFGVAKEVAAEFLRILGATQLPRTTQGGGVPAITLWSLRNHERLMETSARARVAIYLNHRDLRPFDPLEV